MLPVHKTWTEQGVCKPGCEFMVSLDALSCFEYIGNCYVLYFVVLQTNRKGCCCSLGAVIVLPPGRYKVICPCALGVPANETDKPFAELRRVQRGLDKPARCFCYASFFWSSVLQAGSLLPHLQRFTFAFWHWCRFLGPPCSPHALSVSVSESGRGARDPGTGFML